MWDVNQGSDVRSIRLLSSVCQAMQWHPNGDLLCAGFRSRLYQVIDPRSQSNVCEWIVGPRRGGDV